ncbi:hypothetical protein C7D74_33605, partial [Klebsiella pneumoniae]
IEQHLEYLAVAESWDNGKPIRETLTRPAAGGRPIVLNSIWNIWRWRRAGTMGNRSAKRLRDLPLAVD